MLFKCILCVRLHMMRLIMMMTGSKLVTLTSRIKLIRE